MLRGQPGDKGHRFPGKRLKADPEFRLELKVCRELGISHSHFLGGRQRWTELDRTKAIAYEDLLLEECPNCHTLPEDWKDEYGRYLDEPVYTPVARTCPGCAEIARIQEKLPDKSKGAFVTLIPLWLLADDDDDWMDIAEARAREAKLRERLGE